MPPGWREGGSGCGKNAIQTVSWVSSSTNGVDTTMWQQQHRQPSPSDVLSEPSVENEREISQAGLESRSQASNSTPASSRIATAAKRKIAGLTPMLPRACPIWGHFRPKTSNRVTGPVNCLPIGTIDPSRRDDSSLPARLFRTFRHTYPYVLFFRLRFCLESSRAAQLALASALGLALARGSRAITHRL